MVYTGPIDYLDPPSSGVEWDRGITLDTTSEPAKLTVPITAFTAEMIRNESALIMDNWTTIYLQSLKCVVVGIELPELPGHRMEDEAFHILVVSRVQSKAACPLSCSLGKVSTFRPQSSLVAADSLVAWQGRAPGAVGVETVARVVSVLPIKVTLVNLSLWRCLVARVFYAHFYGS